MSTLPSSSGPAPKKHGCFFYGCLTLVILTLLGGVATFFAVRYAVKKVTALVTQYTDAAPLALPAIEISQADYERLAKRVASFREALESGQATDPLVLTSGEINALIAKSPGFAQWQGKAQVQLEGDLVKGQVSMPLDGLARLPGLSRLRGRFMNGAATFNAGLQNGILVVTLDSLQVKGQPVPPEVMTQLRQQNLAKDAYGDPKNAALLSKFESIEVRDGQLIIKARGTGSREAR